MDVMINTILNHFETGKIDRRTAIETIAVAAMTVYGAERLMDSSLVAAPAVAPDRVHLNAILVNHISYTCPDYRKARDFYSDLMGMKVTADKSDPKDPQYGQCNLMFGTGTKEETPYGAPSGTPLSFVIARSRPAPSGSSVSNASSGTGSPRSPSAPDSQMLIDHIAYTIADWDNKKVEEILKARGLNPRPDTANSFHVTDPYGYDLQICGVGMTAFT